MRSSGIVVGVLGLGAAGILFSMTWSCAYTIADGICRAPDLVALRDESGDPSTRCIECLEQGGSSSCCDQVGRCTDDGRCVQHVRAAHECVLAAGPRGAIQESDCRKALGSDDSTETFHAKAAYQCMRDKCGEACGLPSCKLDPAVPRVLGPKCDTCIASACCLPLNECYKSRACRLTVDCIVNECAYEFADNLEAASAVAPLFAQAQCEGAGATIPPQLTNTCIGRCMTDYIGSDFSNDDGAPRASSAICLGARVFACVAGSACASSCRPADVAKDAGTGG